MREVPVDHAQVPGLDRNDQAGVAGQRLRRVREAAVGQAEPVARTVVRLDVPHLDLPGPAGHPGIGVDRHHPADILDLEAGLKRVAELGKVIVRHQQEGAGLVPAHRFRIARDTALVHRRAYPRHAARSGQQFPERGHGVDHAPIKIP